MPWSEPYPRAWQHSQAHLWTGIVGGMVYQNQRMIFVAAKISDFTMGCLAGPNLFVKKKEPKLAVSKTKVSHLHCFDYLNTHETGAQLQYKQCGIIIRCECGILWMFAQLYLCPSHNKETPHVPSSAKATKTDTHFLVFSVPWVRVHSTGTSSSPCYCR